MPTPRPLIPVNLTSKLSLTHLARDTGMSLYRSNSDVNPDTGDYIGDEIHQFDFNGSIGMPKPQDLEAAAQRGAEYDVELIFDPNQQVTDLTSNLNPKPLITINVEVGDFVWARSKKWVVVDMFQQIATTCHLKQFGTVPPNV